MSNSLVTNSHFAQCLERLQETVRTSPEGALEVWTQCRQAARTKTQLDYLRHLAHNLALDLQSA